MKKLRLPISQLGTGNCPARRGVAPVLGGSALQSRGTGVAAWRVALTEGGHMVWIGLVAVVVVGAAWAKVRRNRKSAEAALAAE